MSCVDATWTDHRTLSAKLAGLQKAESLVRMAIVEFLDGGAEACLNELTGGADGGACQLPQAIHLRTSGSIAANSSNFSLSNRSRFILELGTRPKPKSTISREPKSCNS